MTQASSETEIALQLQTLTALREAIARAVVGQHEVVEQLLIGLLAGGHCLLEGVPGLGKTPAAEKIDIDDAGRISGLF